jgi:CheY-like chemotaxis protein
VRTVLLVDNDPLRAALRKSTLERRFRNVHRVADAAEALCLMEQPLFTGNLGLVVTGLNLPGIGGPEFVAELHTRMPQIPVLVLGGASENEADYVEDGVRFLPRRSGNNEMLNQASQLLPEPAL